jgi:hypothetical protein
MSNLGEETKQNRPGIIGYISSQDLPVVIQKNLVIRARVQFTKPRRKRLN